MQALFVDEVLEAIYNDLGQEWGGMLYAEHATHLHDFLNRLASEHHAPDVPLRFQCSDIFYTVEFFMQLSRMIAADGQTCDWLSGLVASSDLYQDSELIRLVGVANQRLRDEALALD